MNHPLPISLHVQDWGDPRVREFIYRILPAYQAAANALPLWIKGLDPPEQPPDWSLDGVWTLGRMFEEAVYGQGGNPHWADMARGAAGAENFFSLHLPHWKARPWVHAWTIGNEPHPPDDIDFLKKLNEFMVRMAQLMSGEGLRPVGPNISVGQPDIGQMPYLGEGMQAMYRWCLHEYSAPAMWSLESWHCLRYRRALSELWAAGFTNLPPGLIGETGIDGGVQPVHMPGTGWKTHAASEDEYVQQLVWQARHHLDNWPIIESALMFTVCQYGWGWDDFLPTDTLLDKLANEIVIGYEIEEKPPPPPPPDFDIRDVSDEMPTHPEKEYEARPQPPVMAVIHHAGYSYPADATEEQVRDHLDVIAKYHINKRDWPGIAYHYVVDGAGRIWQTTGLDSVCPHSGRDDINDASVGICMLGAFHLEDVPTEAQLRSVNCLCQWLEIPLSSILAHKQIVQTACPGKISRFWEDIVVPDETCFEEEGGDEMEVQVVYRNGEPVPGVTWGDIQRDYGLWAVSAEAEPGEMVWRLRRIVWDNTPETNYRTYCKDANGAAMPGVVTFLGATPGDYTKNDLPPDSAPLLVGDTPGQPTDPNTGEPYPNVALKHPTYQTNDDGWMQHSLGTGSNTVPGRAIYQWAWVMPGDDKLRSDWVYGPGGMFEQDGIEHQMFWCEFWLEEEEGDDPGPVPVPPGEYEVYVPEITVDIQVKVPAFKMSVVPTEQEEAPA